MISVTTAPTHIGSKITVINLDFFSFSIKQIIRRSYGLSANSWTGLLNLPALLIGPLKEAWLRQGEVQIKAPIRLLAEIVACDSLCKLDFDSVGRKSNPKV